MNKGKNVFSQVTTHFPRWGFEAAVEKNNGDCIYRGVSEKIFPIHIIYSISGTAFVVYVSKLIGSSSFLQTLGKGTLLLYLGNGLFQTIATKIAYSMIPATTYLSCLVIHLVAYLLCVGIGYAAVKIIYGTKYL